MLKITSTEHLTGIRISGDWEDLNELYDAIYNLLSYDGVYDYFEDARELVLSLCYDLRHAYQGDRETFASADDAPYYAVCVLWPEVIFYTLLLNNILVLAKRADTAVPQDLDEIEEKITRNKLERRDTDLACLRFFLDLVWAELKKAVGEKRFKKLFKEWDILSVMGTAYHNYIDYCTPYVPYLTAKYIRRKPENRRTYLATIAERLLSMDGEYQCIRKEVEDYAKENNIPVSEVEFAGSDYLEEIVW